MMLTKRQKHWKLIGLFLGIVFVLHSPDLRAQQTDEPFTASLQTIAKVYEDSVVLRWAPDKPGAWLKTKDSGFIIRRNEITDETVNDSLVVIDTTAYVTLTPEPVKPLPLEDWEPLVEDESFGDIAAVAAQMLYGDNSMTGAHWMDRADNLSSKFTFALMAADMSHQVADASGLRFVDHTIERDKRYVYQIIPQVNPEEYYIQMGVLTVNSNNISQPVRAPEFKEVSEQEKSVQLKWDRRRYEKRFTAYYVERSTLPDAGFERLTDLPYSNPVTEDALRPSRDIIYTDSLERNYVPYYYRIIGITPFGEMSPPSEAVIAMGRDRTPPPQPINFESEMIDTTAMKLTWEMPSVPPDFEGFYVGRSTKSNEGFTPLFDEPLPPDTRSFTDTTINPYVNHFYVVGAVDTSGNGSLSFAEYGTMTDSIPPAPPQNLKGRVDTTGAVHLSWDAGSEPDILGYQVYYAHDPSHEFTQVTKGPWTEPSFTDSIEIKTLTEEIYYKVMAVDWVHNYSGFSEVLKLKKPDIIPPTKPIIGDYEVTSEGIELEWIPSSSQDVISHELFRKSGDDNWNLLAAFDSTSSNSYVDSQVETDRTYTYQLQAVDDDGNRSEHSTPVRLKMIDFSKKPIVDSLNVSLEENNNQVLLDWSYPYDGEYRFVLYRAVNGANFVSYESLDRNEQQFADLNVKTGQTYEYTIQVVYADGKKSGFGTIESIDL